MKSHLSLFVKWDLVSVLDLLRRIRLCGSLSFREVPNVGAKDFVRVP